MSFQFTKLALDIQVQAPPAPPRRVLAGVTGEIEHATLVAVMGPSGAGKTTFMNVLCGRAFYGTPSGTLKINGNDDYILNHRSKVGFVPQDDIVHGKTNKDKTRQIMH